MKNNKNKNEPMNMLQGSLVDKIIIFALPLAASSVLQQLFNSADHVAIKYGMIRISLVEALAFIPPVYEITAGAL